MNEVTTKGTNVKVFITFGLATIGLLTVIEYAKKGFKYVIKKKMQK